MKFSKLIMTFKDRFSGKAIGRRVFTANSIATLPGYRHNSFNLWGETPEGQRKHLYGKGGQFTTQDDLILWIK